MRYSVEIPDVAGKDPERIQVVLDSFAHAIASGGENLVVPIPSGFDMGRMPEVAMRVAHMLAQYVALDEPTEGETEGVPV